MICIKGVGGGGGFRGCRGSSQGSGVRYDPITVLDPCGLVWIGSLDLGVLRGEFVMGLAEGGGG